MNTLAKEISIGSYTLNHVLEVEVRKSANKLSDSVTLKIPGMAYNAALEIESKINRGDPVQVKIGYRESGLFEEFNGFVSSISTDNTISIDCEDGMFKFRKALQSQQYKDVSVADILKEIVGQIEGFTLEVHEGVETLKYDKFTINDATGFEVLEKIVEENRIHIFVKGSVLHAALKYTYKSGEVAYDMARNVEKSDLKYITESEKTVEVEVIGIKRDNTKESVLVGDPGGDKITVHKFNVTDKEALKKIGEEELKKYRYTGYEGNITTWLNPYVTYGYTASISDPTYPEREGNYYVEAVTTKFSSSGGSRKVTLGIKVS